MGAAGDMLTAALLELLPQPDSFLARLNALGLPGVSVSAEPAVKCGITGTHVSVLVHGEEETSEDVLPQVSTCGDGEEGCPHAHGHMYGEEGHAHGEDTPHGHTHACAEGCPHAHGQMHGVDMPHAHMHEEGHTHDESHAYAHGHAHTSLQDIARLVHALPIPEQVRNDIQAVYELIAGAESAVHGRPVYEIHFHEVGTLDAVADVTAVCLLMHELAPEQIVVSPVHVGSGQVRCAHGILPVPAPATAYLLRDVPIYGGQIRGELCTPTGAALLKHFAGRFGAMPVMRPCAVGYGMGKKDFAAANCVRAILGEAETEQSVPQPVQSMPNAQVPQPAQNVQAAQTPETAPAAQDEICEFSCNVDDMTAEAVGFAMERLFDAGALDVYTVPIGMKKSRPGVLLCVMCRAADRQSVLETLFRHTTTLGIRESTLRRYVLDRRIDTLDTPYGPVRRKVSSGYGTKREKYDYEDLARIARERNIGLSEAACLVDDSLKK